MIGCDRAGWTGLATISARVRRQRSSYPRYHRSRAGLLMHVVLVPLFLSANMALVAALLQGAWLGALVALKVMAASIALQGRAHRFEALAPEPFCGPADAVWRIALEQWVTFPGFVLAGGWLAAWRGTSAG